MGVLTSTQKSTTQALTTLSQNIATRTAEVGAAGAFTTTHVINGIYHQTNGGTPGTRTLPSVADCVAAIPGAGAGTTFRFLVHNADAADTLTVAVDAGGQWTAFGTLTVAAGKNREFILHILTGTTGVVYGLAALA